MTFTGRGGEIVPFMMPEASTHQSHSSHHRDTVNALQAEVEQAGHDDDQVENVPTVGKIFFVQSSQLQNSFEQEECGENLE